MKKNSQSSQNKTLRQILFYFLFYLVQLLLLQGCMQITSSNPLPAELNNLHLLLDQIWKKKVCAANLMPIGSTQVINVYASYTKPLKTKQNIKQNK